MRAILGVVLSACLLVGCGGVEAGEPAAAEESSDVTSSNQHPYCYMVETKRCASSGAWLYCTPDGYSTAKCYCHFGYFDCPPYDDVPEAR